MLEEVPFGPTGRVVYERTYSRTKADGSKETWPETVARVAKGNLALVYGDDDTAWSAEVLAEYGKLVGYMLRFAILPAGRHLWATGATNYLFNCHVSGWGEKFSEHFEFTSMRLFEGGGVGANYGSKHIERFGAPKRKVNVHVTCEPDHQDIEELRPMLAPDPPISWWGFVVEDSREGWADALTFLLDTAMSEGTGSGINLVFDVSRIRPSGSPLVTSGGSASGPAPLAKMLLDTARILNTAHERGRITSLDAMEIDHAIAEAVVSGGTRRSARMAIVHWKDPEIMEFIRCKQDTGKHWTTNISVEIDDEFLRGLQYNMGDRPGNHSWTAQRVHKAVVEAMLANGEPGYWNSSLSQVGEVGEIIATNPCGEIPLEAWENCNLGHVNLDAFAPTYAGGKFDLEGMKEAHRLVTRFLMRATFGDVNDPKQAAQLARNRRIGVGHLGVQGFWAKQGVRYSQIPSARTSKELLMWMSALVREEARDYAFQLRIPEPVKVTTVAPTGSVAKLPGVSEGIHPIYARWFERRVRFSLRDAAQANQVLEFRAQGFKVETDVYDQSGQTAVVVFPTEDILVEQVRALGWDESVVESADEISVEAMLQVQRLYQEHWADNAVSYTVNVPAGAVSAAELGSILGRYLPYLKGTTIMVDESRPQAPYTRITKEQYDSAIAKRVEDGTDEGCQSGACPVR